MKPEIHINDRIGKTATRMEFTVGCSPAFAVYTDHPLPEDFPQKLCAAVETAIDSLVGEDWCWTMGGLRVSVLHSETVDPPDVRHAKFEAEMEACAPTPEEVAKRDALHDALLDDHPNNGTLGYWQIEGIRHSCIVRADHARKALAAAEDVVGAWEQPEVPVWLGEQLPNVIEC